MEREKLLSFLHDDVKRGVRRGVTVAFHRIEPAFLLYLALLLLCRSYQSTMSGDGDVFQGKGTNFSSIIVSKL